MIINDENKFVFISVPKTGSTSIRRRLGSFEDPPPETYHMSIEDILKQYPHVKDYFKFAFVRNPFDRIYSTYINLKYDGHNWATELKKKRNFREFVLGLNDSQYSQYIHLRPQSEYIKLNEEIGVDFVGRFESLKEDFAKIEKKIGIKSEPLKKERWSSKRPNDPKFFDYEMRQVVSEFYKEDFERFKYEK